MHAPYKEKRIKGSLPEWINGDYMYIRLSKDGDFSFSKAHKTNNPKDWERAKSLRNTLNNLNRSLKKKYCTDAIKENVNNSKKLWDVVKKLIPKNKSFANQVSTDSGHTTCDKDTATRFNLYFTSIGNSLANGITNIGTTNLSLNYIHVMPVIHVALPQLLIIWITSSLILYHLTLFLIKYQISQTKNLLELMVYKFDL